jgi:hypothetical protein
MRTLQGLDQASATAEPAPVFGPPEPHLPLASVMAGRHASECDRASPADLGTVAVVVWPVGRHGGRVGASGVLSFCGRGRPFGDSALKPSDQPDGLVEFVALRKVRAVIDALNASNLGPSVGSASG